MIQWSRRLACATLGVVLLTYSVPSPASDASLVDAARKEGEVVWYTGLIINQAVRPVVDAFEKKYPGIKVKASRYAPPETILKITTEAQAGRPQSDVFDGSAAAYPLMEAKAIEPYISPSLADYPADLKDKDGYWAGLNIYIMAPAINTEMVKDADVPKTYKDLLDPRWTGKIAWTNDPTVVGPPGFIGNILMSMGQDAGMAYLRELAKQKIINVGASQRVVLDQVISGQYPLALCTFNNHSVISAAQGAPVRWLKMEPAVQAVNTVGLVKGGPHPNAGRLLIDYLLSEEGQNILRAADYLPAHPKVDSKDPTLKPAGGNFKVTTISPMMVGKDLPGWTKIYNELFK